MYNRIYKNGWSRKSYIKIYYKTNDNSIIINNNINNNNIYTV